MLVYTVNQGECLSSIAFKFGFSPLTLWNHPANEDLRQTRSDRNILQPGDQITVPDVTPKKVGGGAGARHSFKLLAVPVKLKLKLLRGGEPRSGQTYRLVLDTGSTLNGSTDSSGMLTESIPASAKWGRLFVGDDADAIVLELGCLDPADTFTGMQSRLTALGYPCGHIDGVAGPRTEAAVRAFQDDNNLQVDGIAGPNTQAKLKSLFGC